MKFENEPDHILLKFRIYPKMIYIHEHLASWAKSEPLYESDDTLDVSIAFNTTKYPNKDDLKEFVESQMMAFEQAYVEKFKDTFK